MKFMFFTPAILVLPLLILLSLQSASATHLAGARFNAVQMDTGKYVVYFKFIRDCNGIKQDSVSIDYTSGSTSFSHTLDSLHRISVRDITGLNPSCGVLSRCAGGTYPYGMEEQLYVDTVDLTSYSTCEWQITYHACCRNLGMQSNPVDFYNYMTINKCVYNSTPFFAHDVRNFLAYNVDAKLSYGVMDTMDQGDSFSYELVPALQGLTTSIPYQGYFTYRMPLSCWGYPNYSLPQPQGFHINYRTGIVEFRPIQLNQVVG
ncbi:MAG: hypothetical protein GC180_10435 [Bacteroidetes bacterium]|nr:hypothetical protein [Bacteroidota bacterium]